MGRVRCAMDKAVLCNKAEPCNNNDIAEWMSGRGVKIILVKICVFCVNFDAGRVDFFVFETWFSAESS